MQLFNQVCKGMHIHMHTLSLSLTHTHTHVVINKLYIVPQQQLYELLVLYKSTNVIFQNTHQSAT